MPRPAPRPAPRPTPDRRTETDAAPDQRSEPQCRNCPQCPPRREGRAEDRPAPQSPRSNKVGYDYQHFVCPWHRYSPASARIEEWYFSGVHFDGLNPGACHLYEAKHGYDGFLEQRDWSASGRPRLRAWAREAGVQQNVFDRMRAQAQRQHYAVSPHYGEVLLTWVFSHSITRLYVTQMFLDGIPGWYHTSEVRPWTNG